MASPLFQQGENVIRRGEATRYYKGKGGWSNTHGTIWLTNQRIVYWAGFGNQRNWPLDHIVKVQTGMIDTIDTVCVEFDNGMVEWFAVDDQEPWLEAIRSAAKVSMRRFQEAPTRAHIILPPIEPAKAAESKQANVIKQPTVLKQRKMSKGLVALALAVIFGLCGCTLIAVAGLFFLNGF